MKKKLIYETPASEQLLFSPENNFLVSNYTGTTAEDADPEDVDEW